MFTRQLVGIWMLALSCPTAVADDDPVYDGKKASDWVNTIQNDSSARKRAVAATALGKMALYKDSVANLGRSLRVDPSAAVRWQCAAVISGLRAADARQIENDLIEALKNEKESRVRKEIATAVGRFPDVARKAISPLTANLKDAAPGTRAAAADSLAKAGADARGAAPELVPLVDDPDKGVRQAAVFALGRVNPENSPFVAAALVKRFGTEPEVEIRREIVVSLRLLGDKSEPVVTGLAAALADPDDETRTSAATALGTFGPAARPAADALLKLARGAATTDLRVNAVRAFGSVLGGDLKDRTKDLIDVMERDADFEVRLAAVEELGALGPQLKTDADAVAALRKRQSDPQVKVREAAGAAIKRLDKKPEVKKK